MAPRTGQTDGSQKRRSVKRRVRTARGASSWQQTWWSSGSLVHNFGIPTQPGWIDRIAQPGRTFKTCQRPQGLAKGKTVIVASARVAFILDQRWRPGHGAPGSYLQTVMGFFGVTDAALFAPAPKASPRARKPRRKPWPPPQSTHASTQRPDRLATKPRLLNVAPMRDIRSGGFFHSQRIMTPTHKKPGICYTYLRTLGDVRDVSGYLGRLIWQLRMCVGLVGVFGLWPTLDGAAPGGSVHQSWTSRRAVLAHGQ